MPRRPFMRVDVAGGRAAVRHAMAERWTVCAAGHVHWGALGAAGLLVSCRDDDAPRFLLARRSRWVDEGGRWGIPGGAIRDGESPGEAARREFGEELDVMTEYRVTDLQRQDCGGGWAFWTVCARVDASFETFCGSETDATGWFTLDQLTALDLHPGFRRWVKDALDP
ncbi:MAG TPA: NUDIX hydrolase [Solirubrobacteraceae bacterium]|nr:NUDIX hydrolase [Solirubrobacteraceae bacterium]